MPWYLNAAIVLWFLFMSWMTEDKSKVVSDLFLGSAFGWAAGYFMYLMIT